MLFHQLRLIVLSLLLLAVAATGAGVLTRSRAMKEEVMLSSTEPMSEPAPRAAERRRPSMKPDAATTDRMTVNGRVLDPNGKPVKGAVVELVARPRAPWVGASDETEKYNLLGQAESSADGQYRIEAPRTASIRFFEVMALAVAPGFGLGWAALNPDAEQPTADLKLQHEQAARVRLVDVTGMPARGVEVHVLSIGRMNNQGSYEGVSLWPNPHKGSRAWPQPIKTDDQGKFSVPGIGRGVLMTLNVRDFRYARQDLYVEPGAEATLKETTIALEPARIIEGRVLAADTGQPIPSAVVSAAGFVKNAHAHGIFTTKFRADAEGRFIMNPIASERYTVGAFPTGGEPYLIQQDELKWTKGTVRITHDIKLRRGVLIRGKVTEVGSGRPLSASSIQFMPVRGGDDLLSGWEAIVASKDDGSFQIAVPAGKGHLLIFGPTGDYVLNEIGAGRLYWDRPGGYRYFAHAVIPYDVKADDPPRVVATALRPGVTIKGRALGPGGETITDGFVITTLRIEAFNPRWRGDYNIPIRDGRFELHGLAPEATTRIQLLDPEHEWGASVEVSGRQAGQDLSIRLQACGQATARFVGPDGRPIARHQPHFEFVAIPGPSRMSQNKQDEAQLSASADFVANVDRKHYWNLPRTDSEGRITFNSLIPGALYRIIDFSTVNDQAKGVQVRKDFTVKSGEALDLGDIRIDKPRS
jgi:hypothetical protein